MEINITQLTTSVAQSIIARVDEQSDQQRSRTGKGMGNTGRAKMAFELWCGASYAIDAAYGAASDTACAFRAAMVYGVLIHGRTWDETKKIAYADNIKVKETN